MGATPSKSLPAQTQQLLQQLCGPTSIAYDSSTWRHIFQSAFPEPLASLPPTVVEAQLGEYCDALLAHNPATHNFQSLVLHSITLLNDVPGGRNKRAAATGLHLITAVLGAIISQGNSASALPLLFRITPTLPIPAHLVTSGSNQLLHLLIRRVLATLAHVDAGEDGQQLVLYECCRLLLRAVSSQLYVPSLQPEAGAHLFLESTLLQPQLLPWVMQQLLHWCAVRPPPPADGSIWGPAPSSRASTLVWGAASSALAVLQSSQAPPQVPTTLGAQAALDTTSAPVQPLPPSPLADVAQCLLLVLLAAPSIYPSPPHQPDLPSAPIPHASTAGWGYPAPASNGWHPTTQRSPGGSSSDVTRSSTAAAGAAAGLGALTTGGGLAPQGVENCMLPLLEALVDADEAVDVEVGLPGPTRVHGLLLQRPAVSFAHLYAALCAGLCAPTLPACQDKRATLSSGPSTGAEEAALLLFHLLHLSPGFKLFVLGRPDLPRLVVPLLRALYEADPQQQPTLVYMLQICLLLLSQEPSFSIAAHWVRLSPSATTWFKSAGLATSAAPANPSPLAGGAAGQPGSNSASQLDLLGGAAGLTLGSLMMAVLLRVVRGGLGSAGSSPLTQPSNALASLANLAPFTFGLHAHAADRLVALLALLGKRCVRARQQAAAPGAAGAATQPTGLSLQVLEDYLRILLEVANACLTGPCSASPHAPFTHTHAPPFAHGPGSTSFSRGSHGAPGGAGAAAPQGPAQLASNLQLVYALLQQQQWLQPLTQLGPGLSDLVANLQLVLDTFGWQVELAAQSHSAGSRGHAPALPTSSPGAALHGLDSAEQVMAVLRATAGSWRHEWLRPTPELRFVYEQDDGAQGAFFCPYTWGLVLQRCAALDWDLQRVRLFIPRQLTPSPAAGHKQ